VSYNVGSRESVSAPHGPLTTICLRGQTMAAKKCSKCGNEKPLSEFYKHKRSLDGHQYWCKVCLRATNREYELKNSDRLKYLRVQWRSNNKKRESENAKKWRKNNPERSRAAAARSDKLRNPERRAAWLAAYAPERRKASSRWRRRNPDKCRAFENLRRAAKARAVPRWADLKKIEEIYRAASARRLTVDHIVPLRSKLVCGLHVSWNLQLLPLALNVKKGNRHWPDMP